MVRAFRTAEGTVDASLIQSMWIALKAASRKFSAKTAISLNALNFSQTNNLNIHTRIVCIVIVSHTCNATCFICGHKKNP